MEGMQKWVTLTHLKLRKFMSERALRKNLGFHVVQPLLLTLLKENLRRHVGQVILSYLGSLRSRPKSRIQVEVVYLAGNSRKHWSGSTGNARGR